MRRFTGGRLGRRRSAVAGERAAPTEGSHPQRHDALAEDEFEEAWALLSAAIAAAHRGDAAGYLAALAPAESPGQGSDWRIGAFAHYLAFTAVSGSLKHRPTQDELTDLSGRLREPFFRLTGEPQSSLLNLLLTVFHYAAPEQQVRGGANIVWSVALVGILLPSEDQLPQAKTALRRWCTSNAGELNSFAQRLDDFRADPD